MATMIHDTELERRLQRERAVCGADRYDEVWEGVYMMAPMPNDEHQMLVNAMAAILQDVVGWPGLGQVRPGVNVSDRSENWQQNYRVPDVAVFLNETKAVNHSSFWLGGPDLAVEVVSAEDQTREKLAFYGLVSTRELLIIDRDPWQLELHRLKGTELELQATATVANQTAIQCQVVPLDLILSSGKERPAIRVTHRGGRSWTV